MLQLITLPIIAQTTATLLGLAGTAAGIRCIVAPKPFAETFGLPQDKNSEISDSFIPVVGARNIALGLSILGLSFQGNSQAMGTVLLCGLASCVGDSIITWKNKDAASHHIIAGVVFGGLGGYLSFIA